MKLHIILPTIYNPHGELHHTKSRWIPSLSLAYLAALAPKEVKVKVTDERLEPINFDEPYDLVAITVWSRFAKRAYEIAQEYRKRKIPIIMGGPHIYFHEEEVKDHCDSVMVGEADKLFGTLLQHAFSGKLQPRYREEKLPEMKDLPFPKYELLHPGSFRWPKIFPVQTTRGCPYRCNFCEETLLFGIKFRSRPTEEVVEEIQYLKKNFDAGIIYFVDSVFGGTVSNLKNLLRALIPLKIRWTALWTMNNCEDEELLRLARNSGCVHLNMGMESIQQTTIKDMHKNQNHPDRYKKILSNLERYGISYSLNFVFGWDTDNRNALYSTLQFLEEQKVPMAFFNLLTPRRGTEIYERFSREGRILNDAKLNPYSDNKCLFVPKNMKPEELENLVREIERRFFSLRSIFARTRFTLRADRLSMLAYNLIQHHQMNNGSTGNLDPF